MCLLGIWPPLAPPQYSKPWPPNILNLPTPMYLSIYLSIVSQGSWVRYPVWPHTFVSPSAFLRRAVVSYWRKYVHEVLVNRLGGLSLPRKSVVRLTDRPDMTLDVTVDVKQQCNNSNNKSILALAAILFIRAESFEQFW